jgi:DNA-binding CsgD family transcriptional regulator
MGIRNKRTFSCFPLPRAALMLIFLGCLGPGSVAGIKEIGLPFISNFPKTQYKASTQNWSVTQCTKGFMYFGNNDGLLEFDGNNWQLYPLPNFSILRSVHAVGDTIYAGAFEEIGYFARSSMGLLEYQSLTHLIPQTFRVFDEVWKIHQTDQGIVFQSFRYAFIYDGQRIRIVEPLSDFSLSYTVNGNLYIVDREYGLMTLNGQILEGLSNDPVFSRNEVRCILSYNDGSVIIGTNNEGLFLFDGRELKPWNLPLNQWLKSANLFSGIRLKNGYYIFGTVRNGIFITDPEGAVMHHINRFKGLQNNTVLTLYEDKRNNLWLGLDNGIDYIELNSPISILDYNFGLESTYASILFDGKIYAGTNQGLYVMELDKLGARDMPDRFFELIPGTEGQVWNLQDIHGNLFCGHNFGGFLVEGKTARKISEHNGYWFFLPYNQNADTLIAGTYSGLSWFRKTGRRWEYMGDIRGFNESSRYMIQDEEGYIWISHGYRGLFRVSLSRDLQRVESVRLFGAAENLPPELPYNIHLLNNEMVVTTREGVFRFDRTRNVFEIHPEYEDILRNKPFLDKLHMDHEGNLWYFTNTYMGVYRLLENGTYSEINSPFQRINPMLLPAFENILTLENKHVFIGSQNGLIHYDGSAIRGLQQAEPAFIREVIFQGRERQTLFYNPGMKSETNRSSYPDIEYASNSVIFRYASPTFEEPARFSYRLVGFEESWSPWETVNFKEYTNLREGSYVFQVRALNAYHAESHVTEYAFSVQPPLHRSRFAYIVYSMLLTMAIAGNVVYWRKRMKRIRQRDRHRHQLKLEQQEQAFREENLRNEKEIIHLRNESLKIAMGHKTKELANTTMNLIQKNKMLTAIRNQLAELAGISENDQKKYEVQQLIKKINKDLRNEKHSEVFNTYFDEVHQDFINRMREKFPDLSPKELRLCAYLRMNLSTKEIAPLMNISIRGVEISRYRLRKKMKLGRNEHLLDFILNF